MLMAEDVDDLELIYTMRWLNDEFDRDGGGGVRRI